MACKTLLSSAAVLVSAAVSSVAASNGGLTNQKTVTVTVNPSQRYQQFDGMGFSEAFQRGTQIYGAGGLSAVNTSRVLDLLYSNTNGAGMTILRNGIGSSTTNPYDLMKSIETQNPGSPTAPPHYNWLNTTKPGFGPDNGQLRLTKDALARGVQTIYADAWSAPAFMKNNSNENYGGYLCGVSGIECASGDWRQAYANYLVQYLKFYEQEGITIDHVGFLNEPDLNVSYASMLSSGQQAADFLKILYPTVKASGLSTKLACCDGSGWEQQRERLEGLQEAGAEYTLDIVTAHGYSSPLSTPFATSKRVWETEWADLSGPHTLAWYNNSGSGEGLTWANNIQQAFSYSNVSAVLYWIGADNTTSNSALILIDGDTVQVSKRLWAFAQFSRFVKPGAWRVGAESSAVGSVNATAFVNKNGQVAVQVINNGNVTANVEVEGLPSSRFRGNVKGYLTNNYNDLAAVGVRRMVGGRVSGRIPANSMMSFVA